MAKSTEPAVSGWPGFLAELLKSFLLLRDVFGYALPGAVFLSLGVISGRICLEDVKHGYLPFPLPAWAALILVVAACYVVGQILAALAYLPLNIAKWIIWFRWLHQPDSEAWAHSHPKALEWLNQHPTEVSADLLEKRQSRPNLFIELDRRETIAVFAGSTMVALLGGFVVFFWKYPRLSTIVFVAGILLLIDFATAIPHLRRVRQAIRGADLHAPKPPPAPTRFWQALVQLLNAAAAALKKQ